MFIGAAPFRYGSVPLLYHAGAVFATESGAPSDAPPWLFLFFRGTVTSASAAATGTAAPAGATAGTTAAAAAGAAGFMAAPQQPAGASKDHRRPDEGGQVKIHSQKLQHGRNSFLVCQREVAALRGTCTVSGVSSYGLRRKSSHRASATSAAATRVKKLKLTSPVMKPPSW